MVTASDLKWVDIPSLPSGAKLAIVEGPLNEAVPFTFRLRFPADYKMPAHWHPAIEHVTVISGTFNMGIGDKLDPNKQNHCRPVASPSCSPKQTILAGRKKKRSFRYTG